MRHPRIIIASIGLAAAAGQGFEDFFVAAPGLAQIAASSTPTGMVPASPPGCGYGY